MIREQLMAVASVYERMGTHGLCRPLYCSLRRQLQQTRPLLNDQMESCFLLEVISRR